MDGRRENVKGVTIVRGLKFVFYYIHAMLGEREKRSHFVKRKKKEILQVAWVGERFTKHIALANRPNT